MDYVQLFFCLAVIFLLALLLGVLATHLHLPKVTGYLIAGLLAGPAMHHLLGTPAIITNEMLKQFQPLNDLALSVIVLTIGIQCRMENLHRWGWPLIKISAYEISTTLLVVLASIFLCDYFFTRTFATILTDHPLFNTIKLAFFFAIIAVATAPAATLAVIREYEAEGPLTEKLLLLVGFNNLFAISAFIVVATLFFDITHPLSLLSELGRPMIIGFLSGTIISFWAQNMNKELDYQLLLIGGLMGTIGLSAWFHCNLMLTVFVTGATLANSSPKINALTQSLKKIDYPIIVLFFVLSGAAMHLDSLFHVGLLGLVYIISRITGKLIGAWWGARQAGLSEREQRNLGPTLLAQAGVAIGLSHELTKIWPEGGAVVQTVVLGSLIAFELGGPLAVRYGLIHAGEVSLLSILVKKAATTRFEAFHHVVDHFKDALGLSFGKKIKSPKDILVNHVMRRNVETVPASMHFNDFLKMIAYSRYDRFPVVNQSNEFIGVIDYTDIRDMIFDPTLGDLIIVGDIIKKNPLIINDQQSLREVIKIFKKHPNITYLPVVAKDEEKKLLGMLNHNTVLSVFRSLNDASE